jgi:DNA-binding NtrC family response regulator
MGQSEPFRRVALVVENDETQRELLALLLEESELEVVSCDSAEEAVRLLDRCAQRLAILITDVELEGEMDGIDLAHAARRRCPDLNIVVTSGAAALRKLPERAQFLPKPWRPLDVLREAERSVH